MEYYRSSNSEFGDKLDIKFKIREAIQKTKLEGWLTEHYALFKDSKNFINEYETHHQEWPIRKAIVENIELNYPRFETLIGRKPDLVNYSEVVKLIAWKKKLEKAIGKIVSLSFKKSKFFFFLTSSKFLFLFSI